MNRKQLLQRISSGSLKNIAFTDMIKLVEGFGFSRVRVSGSHQIFSHPDIPEMLNLQDIKGEAKPYQIRQFLKLAEKYNLKLEDDE